MKTSKQELVQRIAKADAWVQDQVDRKVVSRFSSWEDLQAGWYVIRERVDGRKSTTRTQLLEMIAKSEFFSGLNRATLKSIIDGEGP